MKWATELFPKGTFPDQKTDGAYLDGTLSANLDIFAKTIVKDMHFLGIICGNDSVGNGKSTLASQVGSYLTWRINQMHGTNNTFTADDVHFNANDLIKKSPHKPKLQVQVLDEGDDLTTHHMKELAVRLKRYFRKCRQLNQIIILILPSFFELPKFFALARSQFLINVKFKDEFERGFFSFYGPSQKKLLYLKGKKFWDYDAHRSDFDGVFSSSYVFFPNLNDEIKKYLKKKHEDLEDDARFEEETKTRHELEREIHIKLFRKIMSNIKITQRELAEGFGITKNTACNWMNDDYVGFSDENSIKNPKSSSNINNLVEGGIKK